MLVGILAWALFFLALLSYFLDARVDEPLTSAGALLSQHPDTRRLASIQASHQQHAVVKLTLPLTTTYPRDKPEREPLAKSGTPETSLEMSQNPNNLPYAVYGSQEVSRQDYLDPQSLAAWSSFGTENVGSHSDPVVQSRERQSQTADYQNHFSNTQYQGGKEEDDEKENEDEDLGNRRKNRVQSMASDDLEEFYFSKSISLIKRLWKGRVSAGMLSLRLQRAMKEYVNSNKHHVSYKGNRKPAQSAKELLCELKNQARLRTVDGLEQPFSSLGWAHLVPSLPLEQLYKKENKRSFKTCAVVTSAGAILRSRLGKEIGKHQISHFLAFSRKSLLQTCILLKLVQLQILFPECLKYSTIIII